MSKHALLLALASFASLASCIQPEQVPPPKFTPNPPYPPNPVPPYGGEINPQPPAPDPNPEPPAPLPPGSYPVAQATANPDEVLSPYPPYNVIDISGPPRFKSGQLARDPSNQKIFRVP